VSQTAPHFATITSPVIDTIEQGETTMFWTFYVILFIACAFMAVLIARAIYAPILRRRENKKWNAWKAQQHGWDRI
jgi:hypothetical protein